jgi:hypothetical protein
MAQTLYFHITLEPHHKHSGGRTGRRIRFVAEVPVSVAKKTASSPGDEQSTYEEAERLASSLTSLAMTGQPHQPGGPHLTIHRAIKAPVSCRNPRKFVKNTIENS